MYADKSFTVESFLSGAEKAFKIIVSSYKEKNIDNAEKLLSPKVLKAFQEQTEIKNDIQSFKITKLKASIINIEIVKKLAKVKVEVLIYSKEYISK